MNQKSYTRGLTNEDVRQETALYAEYIRTFDAMKAAAPSVTYVVMPAMVDCRLWIFIVGMREISRAALEITYSTERGGSSEGRRQRAKKRNKSPNSKVRPLWIRTNFGVR